MKTKLCFFLGLGLTVLAAQARTWTLIPGGKIEGQLASLVTNGQASIEVNGEIHVVTMHAVSKTELQFEGELVLVAKKDEPAVKRQPTIKKKQPTISKDLVIIQQASGETFGVAKTNLIAADRAYIAKMEAELPRFLREQEVLQDLVRRGFIELTRAQVETNSANLAGSSCWMDGEFISLRQDNADQTEPVLWFSVQDKNGAVIERCRVPRDGKKDVQVQQLRRGDKVRLTGALVMFPSGVGEGGTIKFNPNEAEFQVNKVEAITPTAPR